MIFPLSQSPHINKDQITPHQAPLATSQLLRLQLQLPVTVFVPFSHALMPFNARHLQLLHRTLWGQTL